ncbi:Mu transposase domain-containing protein, partial [Mycolicibacterium brumae]|uniref:Mu transposase domain-containing protein n=1 Tax=Mycolicibacterium brumae TaxID=85968 RepID=UPI003907EF19
MKVITNWVIHYLADRVFACLDDLNDAVAAAVDQINDRTPFRGQPRSRRDWFDDHERGELMALPAQRWEPVCWRKAKVHRDWHIQLDTIKYSVPYRFAGRGVDVRIIGAAIEVLADGQIIAAHQQGRHRNGYVSDPEHAPPHYESVAGLWTRGYFLRQAGKVGPATVAALTRLLDGKAIEAQGYRGCMNILDLGKRASGNRLLLEAACRELLAEDPNRPITYTAVKHRISALRAAGGAQRADAVFDRGVGDRPVRVLGEKFPARRLQQEAVPAGAFAQVQDVHAPAVALSLNRLAVEQPRQRSHRGRADLAGLTQEIAAGPQPGHRLIVRRRVLGVADIA